MSADHGRRPQPVELEDVPRPDGVDRRACLLASLVIADPGLAAVIDTCYPRSAELDDTSSHPADPGC